MLSYFTLVDVLVLSELVLVQVLVHAVQYTERTQVIRFMLPKALARQQNINYNYNKRLPRLKVKRTAEKRERVTAWGHGCRGVRGLPDSQWSGSNEKENPIKCQIQLANMHQHTHIHRHIDTVWKSISNCLTELKYRRHVTLSKKVRVD